MPRRAITPDNTNMLRRYVGAIKLGHTVANATTEAGIGETTAYAWLAAGERDEDSPAGTFMKAHKAGVAARSRSWLGSVADADKGWQARAWLLERTDKSYSRNVQPETVRTSNVINIQVTEGQAAGILARLASRGGGGAQNDPSGPVPTLPAAASPDAPESKHSDS